MRTRLAAAAAALSAASFGLLALSPSARAQDGSLDVYDAAGVGQGVVATFAIRPSIFDPLAQAGAFYASDRFSSQGGGAAYSLASQAFPGTFVVGAVGCGGLPGGQWVQAFYPAIGACQDKQESTVKESSRSTYGADRGHPELDDVANVVLDRLAYTAGSIRTSAGLGEAESSVTIAKVALLGDLAQPPVFAAEQLRVTSAGERTDALVSNGVQVTASGVSILGGLVRIDSVVSTATTASDGVTGQAHGDLTFSGVSVTVGGKTYEARIDSTGIHVNDPDVPSHRAKLSLDETIEEGLLRAGVRIVAAGPAETTQGSQAQASVGGLLITLSGTIPSVPVPSALAPALAAIFNAVPTKCVNELEPPGAPPVPLCFGAGVLPGGGSEVRLTLSIASAASFTDAAAGPASAGVSAAPSAGGTGIGTSVLGLELGRSIGGPQPGGSTPIGASPGQAVGPPAQPQPTTPLFGIASEMPSTALAIAGALFLVLAIGTALGPSLRHAGTR